jgi:predicted transcriptional regulator
MSTQITITLTDDVYQKADRFARLANRDIASILADIIQSSIPNISEAATTLHSISLLQAQMSLTEM